MGLKLLIRDAFNLDLESKRGLTSSLKSATFEVGAAVTDGKGNPLSGAGMRSRGWVSTGMTKAQLSPGGTGCGDCSWNSEIRLDEDGRISPDSCIEIALRRDFGMMYPSHEVGRTRTTVRELAEMEEPDDGSGIELMLFDLGRFDDDGDVVSAGPGALPTIVRVSVVRGSLPDELRSPPVRGGQGRTFARRLMVVTRGTRGDIQPFIALARGLAELKNWEVTIVTEMGYKANLKTQSNVKAGAIRFRPSGGDTMKRVESQICQKAINLKINAKQTNMMQKIFLARSEIEFFPSEPAVFYWARKMRPDCLMFGFTMASATLIASEALGIPVIGFVLQPTSIPSDMYPPVLPLREEKFQELTVKSIAQKHDHFKMLKFCMENIGGAANTMSLASLRKRRGLEEYISYEVNTWQELKDKNFPLIIPINETMFGGKPDDWSENSVFTDCIFLRGDTVPPIEDDAQSFIDGCKAMDGKIVVLAFSSMPVSKSNIVAIALKLIRKCKSKACVFALVGGQIDLPLDRSVKAEAKDALRNGRLFLASGAPFGRLFPLVDAVVLHGGLGTTSEALQAKVPAIVTGVLLLDQRFWGSRCSELNVGPFGTHIDDFPERCVEYVDRALADDSVWRKNASRIGVAMTKQAGDDPSGVRRNVECVVRMSEIAFPYYYHQADDREKLKSNDKKMGFAGVIESLASRSVLRPDEDGFGYDEVYVQQI